MFCLAKDGGRLVESDTRWDPVAARLVGDDACR